MHYWAWGGFGKWASFCMRDVDCDESTVTKEYAQAAFKEGWAEFIRRVTYDQEPSTANACATAETIAPLGCTSNKSPLCGDGRYYITDVRSTLCDMWDSNSDRARWGARTSDPNVLIPAEYTDTAQASILTIRSALVTMWNEASAEQKKKIHEANAFNSKDGKTAKNVARYAPFFAGADRRQSN